MAAVVPGIVPAGIFATARRILRQGVSVRQSSFPAQIGNAASDSRVARIRQRSLPISRQAGIGSGYSRFAADRKSEAPASDLHTPCNPEPRPGEPEGPPVPACGAKGVPARSDRPMAVAGGRSGIPLLAAFGRVLAFFARARPGGRPDGRGTNRGPEVLACRPPPGPDNLITPRGQIMDTPKKKVASPRGRGNGGTDGNSWSRAAMWRFPEQPTTAGPWPGRPPDRQPPTTRRAGPDVTAVSRRRA